MGTNCCSSAGGQDSREKRATKMTKSKSKKKKRDESCKLNLEESSSFKVKQYTTSGRDTLENSKKSMSTKNGPVMCDDIEVDSD